MGYDDFSTFSRGRFHISDLTNAERAVFSGAGRVSGAVINGGAAAEIVIFRGTADTPEYMRVNVPIAGCIVVPIGWFAESGLEVITASAAGDVDITIFYTKLSSA